MPRSRAVVVPPTSAMVKFRTSSIVVNNGEGTLRTVHSRRDVDTRYRRNRIDYVPHRQGLRQIDSCRIPSAVCNSDTPRLYPLALPQTDERVERSSAGWRSAARNCEATTLVVSVCVAPMACVML